MLIGTDHRGDEDESERFRSGTQADFLMLLVIDDNEKKITPIQINRDTMVGITTLSSFGEDMGLWTAQICLAHSFGDGKEQSCKLAVQAVSRYLHDATIDGYISLNLDGIAAFNDAIGGVTVKLEDDFTKYDSAMIAGSTITLKGMQAEYYTRMRYHIGEETNISRLKRQKVYIQAAQNILADKIRDDADFFGELYDVMQPYVVTNLTRGRIINIGNQYRQYRVEEIAEIDGESILGDSGYMEFYPDEDTLEKIIRDVFYYEVE